MFSVNVVEDKQPSGVVRASKLGYDILYYAININAAIGRVRPTRLWNLALRYSVSVARDAASKSILTLPVQPEHRAEATLVSSCKLDH
jgi:hypothetical protein